MKDVLETNPPSVTERVLVVYAVSLAQIRALDVPEASRQRFITSQGPFAGQDYCDRFPDPPNIPVGKLNTHDELSRA
ncbi:hypothetical protein JCM24511_04252 [Saitozyma sp. JCM 24511]|nr:hypothetical protein JCM24511_04252 [Saitozyma sp. JCM 24511]